MDVLDVACNKDGMRHLPELVGYYACAAMFAAGHFLPDLMQLTGEKGAVVSGMLFLPIVAYSGTRGSLRGLLRPGVLPWTLLIAWTLSAGWQSGHSIDYAAKALCLVVACAFAALFASSEQFARAVFAGSAIAAVSSLFLVGFTTQNPLELGFCLPLLALVGPSMFGHQATRRSLPMAALVVLSTFRAATIGAGLGYLISRVRRPMTWIGLGLAACAIGMTCENSAERVGPVDRADILGRFMSIEEDGASHRFDLWSTLVEDIARRADDRDVLFGLGIGDTDYRVAELFPIIAAPARDGWVASTHNTVLELILANGLLCVPLVAWALWALVRAAWVFPERRWAIVGVSLVGLANVAMYDLAGGAACFGLLMAASKRSDP